MIEREPQIPEKTTLERARDFYNFKIEEAKTKLESATDPYVQLNAIEEIENAELKMLQLSRREEVLNGKQTLNITPRQDKSA